MSRARSIALATLLVQMNRPSAIPAPDRPTVSPPVDSSAAPGEITLLLGAWRQGERDAFERLVPKVYAELRRVADRYLRRERADHTLQPTALVHEAYLRLAGRERPAWRDRVHFFAVAAQVMRRILVDHARAYRAEKRGGGMQILPLGEDAATAGGRTVELLALDDALQRLGRIDPRKARIVELHYFAGLTVAETAEVMDRSVSTIVLEARLARAWLVAELREPSDG